MYDRSPASDDDIMTVEDFLESVECGGFIDYDGFGHPSNGTMMDPTIDIHPSECPDSIPKDATHIVWYNR